jgi:hypothetical protein
VTPSVALERSTTVDRPGEPGSVSAAADAEVPTDLFALLLAAFAAPVPLPVDAEDAPPSSPVTTTVPGALVIDLRTVATLTGAPVGDPVPVGGELRSPAGPVDPDGPAATVAEPVALDPLGSDSADVVAAASVAPLGATVVPPVLTAVGDDAATPSAASVGRAPGSVTPSPVPAPPAVRASAIGSPGGADATSAEAAPPPVVAVGPERRADLVPEVPSAATAGESTPAASVRDTAPSAPDPFVAVASEATSDTGTGTGTGTGSEPGPDPTVRVRPVAARPANGEGGAPMVESAGLRPSEVSVEAPSEPAERPEPSAAQPSPPPAPAATSAPVVARPAALVSAAEVHHVAPTPAPVPEQLVDVVAPLRDRGDGSYRLAVDVHPGELGRVRLDVQVEAGTVHISLRAEQPSTARLLEGSLDQLRQALESSGVATGQLSLSDGGRQQPGGPDRGRGARRGGPDDDPIAAPLATTPTLRPVSVERALDVLL